MPKEQEVVVEKEVHFAMEEPKMKEEIVEAPKIVEVVPVVEIA